MPVLYIEMDGTGVPVVQAETEGSKLTAATLRSKLGGSCKLRYAGKVLEIK